MSHPGCDIASGSNRSACGSPATRSWRNRGTAPRGCQSLSASSASLRPTVTPTSPVGSFSGSSVELPLASVRTEPLVKTYRKWKIEN
jgi:hypothetical protein